MPPVPEPTESATETVPEIIAPANATPMLRQYLEIKARHPDALLFFRLGDFYELFYDDAKVASEILGITLTSRPKGEERIPMCGVPQFNVKLHVARLVEAGHRVAICDQVEEAGATKTIVKRDVTRIVTPGTVFDEEAREPKAASYLTALAFAKEGGALALIEATTGDFRVFLADSDAALLDELLRVETRELLVSSSTDAAGRAGNLPNSIVKSVRNDREFESKRALDALCRHFGTGSLDGFGLANEEAAWSACAAVLRYVEETQRSALAHVKQLGVYKPGGSLALDAATRRNLDLIRNSVDGRRSGSLLGTIDKTCTSMGGRLLAQWMLYPLTDPSKVVERQDAVAELLQSAVLREDLIGALKEIGDLERLLGRLVVKQGNARDMRQLGLSLLRLQVVRALLSHVQVPLLRALVDGMPDLEPLGNSLLSAIVDEPPAVVNEGGLFRKGFHAELDELLGLASTGRDSIAKMEADEKKRTGIQSLKIKHNRVFGYYIEVTKANLSNVPSDYVRKQTTANGERYITPALQEFESKVLTASERSIALELHLFEQLRGTVVTRASEVLAAARNLAAVDVLLSFARLAADHDYVRPVVDSGDLIRILDGRHPVVERALGREPFVPNDIELDHDARLIVLTGPNMAGKSTAMRQVALVVVLAQMGSYVPAREAVIGACDRLFTRVGAGDDLARGQSTFMVEMSEAANILRNATNRSLVLLDEIGRGTSTFDGLSIAWSMAEHIHDVVRCRTIFATHYHELTQLAHERDHVRNLTMAVREAQDRVFFLRKLLPVPANRSYRIQVAKLSGVPNVVLLRAREILGNLEKGSVDDTGHSMLAKAGRRYKKAQMALGFGGNAEPAPAPTSPILDELKTIDVDGISARDALQILSRWKQAAG